MARPREIDDDRLLESLRESFLQLGAGATTQELAARAGVSEGTLFKRFGSKKRMFALAMGPPPLEGEWYEQMLERAGKDPLNQHLRDIAVGIGEYIEQLIPRLLCSSGHIPGPAELQEIFGGQPPALLIHRKLTRMFEIEIAAGRVHPVPARHLADMLLGSLHHYLVSAFFFADPSVEPDIRRYAEELAETAYGLASRT